METTSLVWYAINYLRLFGLPGLRIVLMVTAVDCRCTPKALETAPDVTGFITEIPSSWVRENDRPDYHHVACHRSG